MKFEIYTVPECEDTSTIIRILQQRQIAFELKAMTSSMILLIKQGTESEKISTPQIFLDEMYIGDMIDLVTYLI